MVEIEAPPSVTAASLPTPDVPAPITLFADDAHKAMESSEPRETALVPARLLADSAGLRVLSVVLTDVLELMLGVLASGVACFLSSSSISSCWEASFAMVSRSLMLD